MVGIGFETKAHEVLLKVNKVDMTFEDSGKAKIDDGRCIKKFLFINFFSCFTNCTRFNLYI